MKFAFEAKIRKLYIKIIDSDIFSYPFSKINENYLFIKKNLHYIKSAIKELNFLLSQPENTHL